MNEKEWWYWFLGFIEGEGSFIINIQKNISFRIVIAQQDNIFLNRLKEDLKQYGVVSSINKGKLDIYTKEGIEIVIEKVDSLNWFTKKKYSFHKFKSAFYLHYGNKKKEIRVYERLVDLKLYMNEVSKKKKRKTKEELMNLIKKNYHIAPSINDEIFWYNPPLPQEDFEINEKTN